MSGLNRRQVAKLWQAMRMLEQAAALIEEVYESEYDLTARKAREAAGEVAHQLDTYDALD